jgi:hypothetical protein
MFESAAGVKREITRNFTWLYIASQNVWVAFIVYLWFSPAYSNLKLGNKDDVPEFSTVGRLCSLGWKHVENIRSKCLADSRVFVIGALHWL